MSKGVDDYEFKIIENFKGYYSSIDPSKAVPNVLVRGSQNVYKTALGTIANRHGKKQFDTVDTTIAGVDGAMVWNTSLGKYYPIRISDDKLQFLSDVVTSGTYVWYDLLTSLTTSRLVADSWWDNTNKKDKLIIVIGNSNTYDWSGGVTIVASGTVNTITKSGTSTWAVEGFAPTGTVTIDGVDYTYTGGTTTTTLTGTSDASLVTAGSVGINKIVTNSNSPASTLTNDFIKTIDNQIYVGSYTSRLIYVSKDSSYTDFTQSTPRIPGDGELITLDAEAKGIGVRDGKAHIFGGTSDLYIIKFNQITVGSTLTEQTLVEKKQLGALSGAYAHEFIDVLGDNIVYLSQDQQLREYGDFANFTNPVPRSLSEEVSTDLANEVFTLGQLKVIASGDRGILIYITAPTAGVTYIYQIRTSIDNNGNLTNERLWYAPFIWGLSRIDVRNGTILGFSNSNPQTYTIWDTNQWHDDSPSAENLAYTSVALFSYQSHGRRQGKLSFDKIYWEGYMPEGTKLYGGVYYDYQGATRLLSPIIHSVIDESEAPAASFFTGVTPPSLGDASLGDNPLGGITEIIGLGTQVLRDHDLLPKFRIITGVQITHCYEYALMVYTTSAGDRWELLALGANPTLAPASGVEITK